GRLAGLRSDLVSREAAALCRSKALTTPHLARAGLPVPDQRTFDEGDREAALRFARDRAFDVVVKPAVGAGGRGVTTALADDADFGRAWALAIDQRTPGAPAQIVVESK